MTWRPVRTSEHDGVASLMLALYAEDPAPAPMTRDKAARTLERLAAEPLRGVVVVCDTAGPAVAGYALLCSFWSNELGGEVCVIDELYVVPAERGRGRATELVRGLCDRTLPWFQTAVAVELEVTPGNSSARALYERLGFCAYKNALMRAVRT